MHTKVIVKILTDDSDLAKRLRVLMAVINLLNHHHDPVVESQYMYSY